MNKLRVFIVIVVILMAGVAHCVRKQKYITCNEKFDACSYECATICARTIKRSHQFGKCFSICLYPCRKDYCKEAYMVEMVDTKDLKSFAKIKRGGSSPSVSSILKRR